MILLERLLDGLEVAVQPFSVSRLAAGESAHGGRRDEAVVHYLLDGAGGLSIEGLPAIRLERRSAVIVPAGHSHRFAAGGEAPGEGGVVLACGAIGATFHRGHGLFDYLPEPIMVRGAADRAFADAFEALLAELAHPQPGTDVLVRALMQQCLVHVLRRYCESGECRVPWLIALEDERIGCVVRAMLDDPGRPFTVERLAEVAGMSRSTFAEHFRHAFGRGPIDFLKEVRLRRAAALLVTSERPVKAVGAAVGYDSRSHFSRAFFALYGCTPTAWRANTRAGALTPG